MDAENNMTNTSTSIKDERRKNKRRRSISSVSSCGTGTEPMVIHPPDGTSSNNAVPPPLPSTTQPQLINHNNKMMHHHHHPGVKTEPLMSNTSHHYHHQDMNHHFHHPPDFMDTLTQSNNSHNQSISAQEIEDDDLEMLQYAVRPGPSNGNNADGLSNMHQGNSVPSFVVRIICLFMYDFYDLQILLEGLAVVVVGEFINGEAHCNVMPSTNATSSPASSVLFAKLLFTTKMSYNDTWTLDTTNHKNAYIFHFKSLKQFLLLLFYKKKNIQGFMHT